MPISTASTTYERTLTTYRETTAALLTAARAFLADQVRAHHPQAAVIHLEIDEAYGQQAVWVSAVHDSDGNDLYDARDSAQEVMSGISDAVALDMAGELNIAATLDGDTASEERTVTLTRTYVAKVCDEILVTVPSGLDVKAAIESDDIAEHLDEGTLVDRIVLRKGEPEVSLGSWSRSA